VTWGGVAAGIVVIAGIILYLTQPAAVRSPFVTTLQKGEFRTVPNACRVVSAATLSQSLAGTPKSFQPYNFATQSECTFTVDAKPTFRVMNATLQAYLPAAYIASGNGSATATAAYTYYQQRQQFIKPPKHAAQPPATVTPIAGLGQQALSAVQVFRVGTGTPTVTDRVTVLVRYRNVLITASVEAQVSGGFGPASISDLQAGALATARQLLAAVMAEPTVS